MRNKRTIVILLITLSLLCIQDQIYDTALSLSEPSIRLLSISVGGKSLTYEDLPPDSLIEVEVQQDREVQVAIILEMEQGTTIRIWTGLSNPLFSIGGGEITNKGINSILLKTLEQKLIIQVYGTYIQTHGSTIILISLKDSAPLLTVRSKTLGGYSKKEESSELEKKISELEERLLKAQLPTLRKEGYTNLILHARIAKMKGNNTEALEIIASLFDKLQDEQLKSKEVMILIENANTTLKINKAKLPSQRIASAESLIKLALLEWEAARYEEAKKLANEAKNLATWSTWEELEEWIIRLSPFVIGGTLIIPLALVFLRKIKRKQKTRRPVLPREIYGE